MTQDLVAANVDGPALLHAGGWSRPDTAARYGERLAAGRGALARLAESQRRMARPQAVEEPPGRQFGGLAPEAGRAGRNGRTARAWRVAQDA